MRRRSSCARRNVAHLDPPTRPACTVGQMELDRQIADIATPTRNPAQQLSSRWPENKPLSIDLFDRATTPICPSTPTCAASPRQQGAEADALATGKRRWRSITALDVGRHNADGRTTAEPPTRWPSSDHRIRRLLASGLLRSYRLRVAVAAPESGTANWIVPDRDQWRPQRSNPPSSRVAIGRSRPDDRASRPMTRSRIWLTPSTS